MYINANLIVVLSVRPLAHPTLGVDPCQEHLTLLASHDPIKLTSSALPFPITSGNKDSIRALASSSSISTY